MDDAWLRIGADGLSASDDRAKTGAVDDAWLGTGADGFMKSEGGEGNQGDKCG